MKTITFDEEKWKLVPKEPTEQMMRELMSHVTGSGKYEQWVYRSMLAAAPTYKGEQK